VQINNITSPLLDEPNIYTHVQGLDMQWYYKPSTFILHISGPVQSGISRKVYSSPEHDSSLLHILTILRTFSINYDTSRWSRILTSSSCRILRISLGSGILLLVSCSHDRCQNKELDYDLNDKCGKNDDLISNIEPVHQPWRRQITYLLFCL